MNIDFQTQTPRETIEDIMGPLGFRVVWSVEDHWANVRVFEKQGHDPEDQQVSEFELAGSTTGETTEDLEKAKPYLEGHIEWNGCAELDQGCPYWGGLEDFKRHVALLHHLYVRAFQLMGREPEDTWEWPTL